MPLVVMVCVPLLNVGFLPHPAVPASAAAVDAEAPVLLPLLIAACPITRTIAAASATVPRMDLCFHICDSLWL
ncbi:hypothetical protein GCM10022226_06160 [Sphaerisporangium flaviroseum]|uniref:Secreted peptide n=1 Tax=Sphaerisporangium flaviroseum TaxID=509199 RepID=A0ABP7HIU8_9ACTN